ncbi:MAG: AMP-binding protein [Baekduia sp.]
MNFWADVVERRPREQTALIELAADGARREWTFAEVAGRSSALSAEYAARGVGRGDVVMTMIGSRPEWVLAMVACFRIGAVALPVSEQLRPHDLEHRIAVARPKLLLYDERNADVVRAGAAGGRVAFWAICAENATSPAWGDGLLVSEPASLAPEDPCLITFTSGTTGEAKGVLHGQRYLSGQVAQAKDWLGAEPGDIAWCTASTGWSKSARNVFIAPWICGAAALLHDGRFDPHERLEIIEREQVNALCMAPTEYRLVAKRAELRPLPQIRSMVAAGEALNPEVLAQWREATGVSIRDGYGQTETGQLTGVPAGTEPRPGSMGRALDGIGLRVEDGELVADPATVPTFFLRYLGEEPPDPGRPWHTGDRVTQDEDGWLFFEGRADDVIISAGYRIGPFEVESALVSHRSVAEAAAVAEPDEERGAIVRAIVVLRDGFAGSPELAAELQHHVRTETAPYKYPRIVEFAAELPKTASGKVRRAALRQPR